MRRSNEVNVPTTETRMLGKLACRWSRGEEFHNLNGDVPPFGHATQLRIFIDPELLQYDGVKEMVWAAAGTWNDNFAIAANELIHD